MIKSPFKVFYNQRPIRIAYLIDKTTTIKEIVEIIRYCSTLWGGRYNPIIYTDGKGISESDFMFLEIYDPDYIKTYIDLDKSLIEKIQNRLNPYVIRAPKDDFRKRSPEFEEIPVKIIANPTNVNKFGKGLFSLSTLAIFTIDYTKLIDSDNLLHDFLSVNFGLYERTVFSEERLGDLKVANYKIESDENVISALEDIADDFNERVYLNQLCSLPNYIPPPLNNEEQEFDFTIVVGDSPSELVFFWNKIFSFPEYEKTRFVLFWIPSKLINQAKFQDPIKKMIAKYSRKFWNQNSDTKFVSTSLELEELETIRKQFTEGLYLRSRIEKIDEINTTLFHNYLYNQHIKDLPSKKFYELKDILSIETPESLRDANQYQNWAVELYIEYNSARFDYISGPNYWVQLPKRNWLSKQFTRSDSRINSNGFITNYINNQNPIIRLKIISDYFVFNSLLKEDIYDIYPKNDLRNIDKYKFFKDIDFSDKGNYLDGVLKLFGTLSSAHYCLLERYWRKIFDYLSDRVKISDERYTATIKEKIKQQFNDVKDLKELSERKIDFLTRLVNVISKERMQVSKSIPFSHFEEIAQQELVEFNKMHSAYGEYKLDEKNRDLLGHIHQLLDKNILRMGISSRCPQCRIKNWHTTSEIKRNLTCNGCQFEYTLNPEPQWQYRLNTLFELGYSQHGLLPVILVLGQLLKESRSSFLYTNCINLYDEKDDTIYYDKNVRPIGDIDIVCIKDGEFIIGEVKQSCKLFNKTDFDKMYDIATRICPDKVIFSSVDVKPSEFVLSSIQKLSEKLIPFNICCEWYQLDNECFEPTWIR